MGKPFKALFAIFLAFVMLIGSVVPAYAMEEQENEAFFDAQRAAEALNKIGLFKGDGSGFALERVPNRAEVATMFVRLLGKEAEALAGEYSHPFTDCDMWASQYIGYMYQKGLTKGVSETEFAPYEETNANMYLTFALRALGYDSTVDFQWDKAAEKALEIGLLTEDERDKEMLKHFDRGGLAIISFRMLFTLPKDGLFPLAYLLVEEGSLDVEKVYATEIGKALDNIDLSAFLVNALMLFANEEKLYEYLEENLKELAEIMEMGEEELKSIKTIEDLQYYHIDDEKSSKLVEYLFNTALKAPRLIDYKISRYWASRNKDYTMELMMMEERLGFRVSIESLSWISILLVNNGDYIEGPVYVKDIDLVLFLLETILNQPDTPFILQ